MNKAISLLGGYIPVIFTVIGFSLIFISIPVIGIEIIMGLDIAFGIGICIWKSTTKKFTVKFPTIISCFCCFTIGMAITTTRTFLTVESYEEQIPLVRVLGEIICKENIVYGFTSTIIIGIFLSFFCLWFAGCFLNDSRSSLFSLENKLRGEMLQTESAYEDSNIKIEEINKFEEYYFTLESAVKLVSDIFKTFLAIFCIDVAGGTCQEIFIRGMFWKDALNKYMILSSGYFIYLCIPLIIVSFSFRINEKKYYTCII